MKELEKLRILHNYNYRQMGELLGVSKTYYWQIEHEKRGLSYIMAIKIANVLHVTPDQIFYDYYINKLSNK
ncbi:MAG: helix-turn-helix transcriptional regulator [Bacilli bacterium]|nr:helix-turn-helix transcriptional regulator [Bacilli bacterium]